MKLVAGLGNPGRKYQGTRHNVGFEVIEHFAKRHGAEGTKNRFDGEVMESIVGGERVMLLMPHTLMNLSGRSVRQAVAFYKLELDDLLLVCDDFHLPLGTMRLRAQGSDGGQKGLANTIAQLGSDEFARLRVGIGPVPDRWDAAEFVLGKFGSAERKTLDDELIRIGNAVEMWIAEGTSATMNRFNGSLRNT